MSKREDEVSCAQRKSRSRKGQERQGRSVETVADRPAVAPESPKRFVARTGTTAPRIPTIDFHGRSGRLCRKKCRHVAQYIPVREC